MAGYGSLSRKSPWRARIGLALVVGVLAANASAASYALDQVPAVSQVSAATLTNEVGQVRKSLDARELPAWQPEIPAQRASVTLEPMFSAQAGSWPFEPFVANGLFRAIATYQNTHPRAIVIRGGSITPEELLQALGNPRIMRRHKDGYLVSYPIIIASGGALRLDNTALYLYTFSGTALINQGLLTMSHSSLESWNGEMPMSTDRPYRPFVVAWAGSKVHIQSSKLTRLGYNANLSRGFSAAHSKGQGSNVPPAQVWIQDSEFQALSALELHRAESHVIGNRFSEMQQYGIDVNQGRFDIRDNRIEKVDNNSGIRVQGVASGLLRGNRVFNAFKSGIEVVSWSGELLVRGNVIGDMRGVGIRLDRLLLEKRAQLLIEQNVLGNIKRSAIEVSEAASGYIVDNRIGNVGRYAINIHNPVALNGRMVVIGNHLNAVGQAMVNVLGIRQVVLGHNRYEGKPLLQNLLIGDLMPIQAELLDATVRRSCYVQVEPSVPRKVSAQRTSGWQC